MKKILLLVLPIALLGLVLYLRWAVERVPPDPTAPGADMPASGTEALQGRRGLESAWPQDEVQREELERPESASAVAKELYRIRVVHKGTGEPAPGARVSYFEEDANPFAIIARGVEDHEAEALEHGETVCADSQGIALVAVEQRVRITGRHERLYGETALNAVANHDPEQEQEYDLALERDLGLTVRVLDFNGEPAAGVVVGLAPLRETEVPRLQTIGTSSEDGLVEEAHLQSRLRPTALPSQYILRAMIPGLLEGGVTIDPEDLFEDPIELRLPQTGRVLVRLADASGNLLPEFPLSLVRLAIPPDEIPEAADRAPPPEWRTDRFEGGVALFEHVVAGRSYQARAALRQGWAEGLLTGPRQQDDEIRFDLRMDQGYYGLTGRILDADGNPIPETSVRAQFESETVRGGPSFQTRMDGSFWVFLRPAERDTILSRLYFEILRSGAAPLRSAPLLDRTLVLGTNDVGDVILGEPELQLIGSGRILVDGEPPATWPEGRLRVLQWDPIQERWLGASRVEVSEGAEGLFEIHTPDLVEHYRLEYGGLPRAIVRGKSYPLDRCAGCFHPLDGWWTLRDPQA